MYATVAPRLDQRGAGSRFEQPVKLRIGDLPSPEARNRSVQPEPEEAIAHIGSGYVVLWERLCARLHGGVRSRVRYSVTLVYLALLSGAELQVCYRSRYCPPVDPGTRGVVARKRAANPLSAQPGPAMATHFGRFPGQLHH